MDAGLTVRAIEDHEIDEFRSTLDDVFAADLVGDAQGVERLRALLDRRRTYCAFDGDRMVATGGAFEMQLAVPGGVVPMGGLTMVTVRPTHRRRGILRAIVAAHLADVRARGEPLSGLWASEASIYGRFGYGIAVEGDEIALSSPPGVQVVGARDEILQIDEREAGRVLPEIYAEALTARPGLFARSPAWWQHRRLSDRPEARKGRRARSFIIARRGATPTGYAMLRQQLAFEEGVPAGAIEIEEMVALDGSAETSLWRYLTNIDLFPKVSWWNAPVDSVLRWVSANPRAARRRRRLDTLWLRICDVGAALRGRAYGADGLLRLSVSEPGQPAPSTWELAVEGGVGRCTPTSAEPDLRLSVAALGSIYLAGTAPSVLASAGAISGHPVALARADRMFAWSVAPWCPEIF